MRISHSAGIGGVRGAAKFCVLLAISVPITGNAHHSRAAYDTDKVSEVEGELIGVRWRNPHIVFTLRVETGSGQESMWRMEAGSIYMLKRAGLSEDLFTSGVRVKVAGHLSKHEERDFLANSILFPDDNEILTMPGAQPHWDAETLGGRGQWAADSDQQITSDAESGGIFQVWSIPKNPLYESHLPFTEEAIAARARWDMVDNPYTRCEQPGMPRIMMNPHPFEFIDEGDTIRVLGEEFDMVRIIHMDSPGVRPDQPASRMGYSVGSWVGGSLVVTTSRVNWPYFDGIGTPQSDQVEFVETFTLRDNGGRLDYLVKIADPATFTDVATVDRYWLALGETVEPFDCEVY